VKTAIDT